MTRPLYMVIKVNFAGVSPMVRIAHVHADRDLLLSLCIAAQTTGYGGVNNHIHISTNKEGILAELRQQEYSRQMCLENYDKLNWIYFVKEVPSEASTNNHPLS